jgi:hypothetical protein
MALRGALMSFRNIWQVFPGKDENLEFPIEFSDQEIREHTENEQMWYKLNLLVNHWRDELGGLSEEGLIVLSSITMRVKRNESLRAEFFLKVVVVQTSLRKSNGAFPRS